QSRAADKQQVTRSGHHLRISAEEELPFLGIQRAEICRPVRRGDIDEVASVRKKLRPNMEAFLLRGVQRRDRSRRSTDRGNSHDARSGSSKQDRAILTPGSPFAP